MAKQSKGLMVGIEAKLSYMPVLDSIGDKYESLRRVGLNRMQSGWTENQIEKKFQREFNIQWTWADSIATEVKQLHDQLTSAKANNISRLKEQIKKKTAKARKTLSTLEKQLKTFNKKTRKSKENPNPTVAGCNSFQRDKFNNLLMGLKSKVKKIDSLKKELQTLLVNKRLHICFGSKKLFNAQHHLEENGYLNHDEWKSDWEKARGGRFYCIGKSSHGGGTAINIFHVEGDQFKAVVKLPRCLWEKHGVSIELPFEVKEDRRKRKSDLLYALKMQKPVTTMIFRREGKGDQWYIHLTTYIQNIPIVTSRKNGCLGTDFNANSVDWTYIKADGNIKAKGTIPFVWTGKTTGERVVMMRDLVADLQKIASAYECPIAIEALDFSKKKASMSEASAAYNSMLSNLSTSMFKDYLSSRCRSYGVELIKVNPAYTSVIGMIKFMQRYGLNSGTAAAMAVARRALKLSERVPMCLQKPEDLSKHPWSVWNSVSKFLKFNRVKRCQLFNWMKSLENMILENSEPIATAIMPSS